MESAIAALERAGDDRGLARAWRLLGYEHFMRCRIDRAEAALARTIEHARRAADERVDAYARGMLAAAAFWGPLPVAEGVDRCRRLLSEAAGNRYVEGSVLHVLGALAAMQGRFDQARDLVDQGAEVAAALGRLRLAAIWSQFAATVDSLAGRPEAASERSGPRLPDPGADGGDGARSNLAADLAHALAVAAGPRRPGATPTMSRALAAREDLYAQVRWRAATARALAADGGGDLDRAVRLASRGGRPGRDHRHAEPPGRRPGRPGRGGRPVGHARGGGGRRRPLPAAVRAQGQPVAAAAARARLDLPPAPSPGRISGARLGFGDGRGEAGMPHWGFRANQRDLPGQLLDQHLAGPDGDFHPVDAGRLLALGRALGQLGRITSEDPDFQVKAQDSRDALAAAVQAVLALGRRGGRRPPGRPRAARHPHRGPGGRLRPGTLERAQPRRTGAAPLPQML